MAVRFCSFTSNTGLLKLNSRQFLKRNVSTKSKSVPSSTVDTEEVAKFSRTAQDWWKDGTHSQILQSMNKLRVPLIRDGILSMSELTNKTSLPLKEYKIIDVGCGGGLLAEPLARLGASVTGLDPGLENIESALEHAVLDVDLKENLKYVHNTVEAFVESSEEKFDGVVCSEVIEHVADPQLFVKNCVELAKDGGSLFFTTSNRTVLSLFTNILAAEYVLGIVPRGTHNWNKFVTPKELRNILESYNCRIVSIEGIIYNPVYKQFNWCDDTSMMYALHAVK